MISFHQLPRRPACTRERVCLFVTYSTLAGAPLLGLESELAFALGVCLSQALTAGAAADKQKQDAVKEEVKDKAAG